MMSRTRFVLDTNLIVSAALMERSFARQVFELALYHGDILVSDETQDELMEVLMRPKFDRYVVEEKRQRFLTNFFDVAVFVAVTERILACRDPKDDKFLELAISGKAECIITGDADLLALHPFRNISILRLAEFANRYE